MSKIIQVVPTIRIGGLQKVCAGISRAFTIDDHEVHVVSLQDAEPDNNLLPELDGKVKFSSCGGSSGFFSFTAFVRLFLLMVKIKPNIIHTHGVALCYMAPYLIFSRHCKFVHTLHNEAEYEAGKARQRIQRYLISKFGVKVIVLSPLIDDSFRKSYNLESSAIIGNSALPMVKTTSFESVAKEINRLKNFDTQKVIVNVGRICFQKKQKLLITSFKEIYDKRRNSILIILGDSTTPEEAKLKEELLDLSLGYPIFFLGNKSNVSDYLLASDLFCLSSNHEGFPISVLEAFSAGLPVLSTDVGGMRDIISSPHLGKVVTDNGRYSELLDETIQHINEYDAKIIKQHYFENFTYQKAAERHYSVYFT